MQNVNDSQLKFTPALRYHFLTPIYDRFFRLFLPEKKLKVKAIELLDIQKKDHILDFGCGTGTLCQLILTEGKAQNIIGIDVDVKILEIARNKKQKGIEWQLFNGVTLFYENDHFDRIISTWVFHHMEKGQVNAALAEIHRTLHPNGTFLIADWGKPIGLFQKVAYYLVCKLDGTESIKIKNVSLLLDLARQAGFILKNEIVTKKTLFGTLYYYSLSKKHPKFNEN
jgi:ubiquinone/menaquinone biosynthesis C-methylase UbiE